MASSGVARAAVYRKRAITRKGEYSAHALEVKEPLRTD